VLAGLISARLPRAAVLNLGQPGTTATTYLPDRRISRITKLDPAAVIHMVGSNDYARLVPPAAYGATMRDRLDKLDAGIGLPCQHVLIQTFARVDVTDPVAPWAAYGEELHTLTEGHPHRVVLDVSEAFADVGVRFGGTDPLDLIGPDGIHMGDAGHRLMAELVWSQLS
jgi:lysophospholipase L1-like esterase